VRAAVLLLLEEQDRNGYQIIQELTQRSNETWRPSPGSIYPVLQQLEDEGLVAIRATESGRTYGLSEAGKALVNEKREQFGTPWENKDEGFRESAQELALAARQVAMATRQVLVAGSDAQRSQVATLLADTRRAIYGILAEGDIA
jgi:DNA-binding PadR family transcriptional regulator